MQMQLEYISATMPSIVQHIQNAKFNALQLEISIFIIFSIKFLINQAECVHNSDTYMHRCDAIRSN